jgi:hypothetical protein
MAWLYKLSKKSRVKFMKQMGMKPPVNPEEGVR